MKQIVLTFILFAAAIIGRAQCVPLSGTLSNNKIQLSWSTDANESTDRFEVEKSFDSINFKTAALVFTSEKKGAEDYKFYEPAASVDTIYYRLKIYGPGNQIRFTKPLSFSVVAPEKKE